MLLVPLRCRCPLGHGLLLLVWDLVVPVIVVTEVAAGKKSERRIEGAGQQILRRVAGRTGQRQLGMLGS